jgi:hypothetical protein
MTRGSTQGHEPTQPSTTAVVLVTPSIYLSPRLQMFATRPDEPLHGDDDVQHFFSICLLPRCPLLFLLLCPPSYRSLPIEAAPPPSNTHTLTSTSITAPFISLLLRECPTLTTESVTTARSTPVGRATAGTRPPAARVTVHATRPCAASTTGSGRGGGTAVAWSARRLPGRR